MDTQLKGLTVFITGASGGIGQSLADLFGREGANLLLHSNTQTDSLSAFVEQHDWKERTLVMQADVRDPEAVGKVVEAGVARFGRLDVCIVNAGIWPPDAHLLQSMPESIIRNVIEVNLLGAIWTARAFLQALEKTGPRPDHKGASICFIGSTAGHFGEAYHSPYAATKSAMIGLMLSLKNEIVRVDPYGRVNTVEPGWTVTPMAEEALREEGVIERVVASMPLRQLARAQDVATAVVFLSAPGLSRHVSGQTITVAGGMEGRQQWRPHEVDTQAVRARLSEQ